MRNISTLAAGSVMTLIFTAGTASALPTVDGNFGLSRFTDQINEASGQVDYGLYEVSEWEDSSYSGHFRADPWRMKTGAHSGDFTGQWGFANGSHVLEGSFGKHLLGDYTSDPMTIHWTKECGNDYLDQTSAQSTEPSAPVPEPATICLLVTGLLSMALSAKKRFKSSSQSSC